MVYRLPVLARLLAFFRSFTLSPCVCPSVLLSCDFAPFPCVFLAVACLALRCPFRPFDFNALFRRFTARFGSARAIRQGNKKARFMGNFQGVFAFVRSWSVCPVEKIKKGKAVKPYPVERLSVCAYDFIFALVFSFCLSVEHFHRVRVSLFKLFF